MAEPARKPRRTGLAAAAVAMLTCGLVGGVLFAHNPILDATGLRDTEALPPAASTLFPPPPSPTSTTTTGAVTAPPMAEPDTTLSTETLTARLNAVPRRFDGVSSAMVLDTASGTVLYANNPASMLIPASNMKTLTMLGALAAMPGDQQLTTAVTSPAAGVIVLRGGGDPYLRSIPDPDEPGLASTQVLAEQTAAALKQAGTTTVTLGYDESLFTGPDWAPTWPTGYVDQVTRISALMVDGGMTRGPDGTITSTARSQTPALTAATLFATQLAAQGITVTGQVSARPAGAGEPLAEVDSLPLEQVATLAMVASDNTATEMILRHVAIARDAEASFTGGTTTLVEVLTELGVWRAGAQFHDGSGLSRSNQVNAEMLAAAWRTIASTERLRTLITATPVARVSGTLRDRFLIDESIGGRGRVHAKTGTLSEVSSLSGWTVTASGQSVIIVFMVNQSKDDWWARAWIDTAAAVVSECGCA
ncbi:D-alanyl-D-alanine carboxypeptidase/D-alanyl-D-alanine endopeptidase [Propionibacteriaceae bacterium Y1923]|uniref:D-alanyl-D-alanine carboxypeptidase/D-alanyl-D-alanine endopeptidase n=1 Tax=Aestuariimicrobium sp. Y1814 TaxID=3418742 RepID=UPI003C1BB976